jgi:hypothetical protein
VGNDISSRGCRLGHTLQSAWLPPSSRPDPRRLRRHSSRTHPTVIQCRCPYTPSLDSRDERGSSVKSKTDGKKPNLSAMIPGVVGQDDGSISAAELDESRS